MSDYKVQPGPGIPKGQKLVRNEGVKKIQALAMMRELALGKTPKDVAKQFNTSVNVVKARLSYAQRAGLFVQHEDVILTQMVPAAQSVLLNALHNPYLDPALRIKVALEVEKGVGLLRKPGTAAPAALQGANRKAQATLEDYINQLRDSAGKLPEGVAVDAEYSIAGLAEPPSLTPGLDEPSGEEQTGSGRPDELHRLLAEAIGEGTGEVNEAARDGESGSESGVSEAIGPQAGEASGEDCEKPDCQGSYDSNGFCRLCGDSRQAAEEHI